MPRSARRVVGVHADPYALVLLQLRVFYARQQPWTPIAIMIVITAVKVAASLLAPHVTDDRELVAGCLGLANGVGFLAGAPPPAICCCGAR